MKKKPVINRRERNIEEGEEREGEIYCCCHTKIIFSNSLIIPKADWLERVGLGGTNQNLFSKS